MGGPNSLTGDKFRTKEEFKKDLGSFQPFLMFTIFLVMAGPNLCPLSRIRFSHRSQFALRPN